MMYELVLNEKCNLDCQYCFEKAKGVSSIDKDMIPRLVDFLQDYAKNEWVINRDIVINFNGGEALLNYSLLQQLYQYSVEKGINQYSLSTNFVLANEETIDFLVEKNIWMHISIDGDKATHDLYRKDHSGNGSFDKVCKNIEVLLGKYPDYNRVSYSMVYTPETVNHFYDNVKFLYDLGLRNIAASYASNYQWDEQHIDEYVIQLRKIAGLYKQSYEKDEQFHFSIISDYINGVVRYGKSDRCGAFIDTLCILPSGAILPCLNFIGEGDAKDYDFGTIYDGIAKEKVKDFLETIDSASDACKGCDLYDRCHNTCYLSYKKEFGACKDVSELSCVMSQRTIFEVDKVLEYMIQSKNKLFEMEYLSRRDK
jgi:radical SAM protein with 4Fe4S-binding SPASM domain